MIFLPCPNYPTRLLLWQHFIQETGANLTDLQKNPKFDLTTLSFISEGYSAGNIQSAVHTILPARRVKKLKETGKSIDISEFITALSRSSYTYKNDYKQFQKFTEAVTGEKERKKAKAEADALAPEHNTKGSKSPARARTPAKKMTTTGKK